MSAYLTYPQRIEYLYQIYDGSKNSKVIRRHLRWVLTILLYPLPKFKFDFKGILNSMYLTKILELVLN